MGVMEGGAMKTSRRTSEYRSSVPPEPAEVAMRSTGWRRTGLLRRLVKAERRARTERPAS